MPRTVELAQPSPRISLRVLERIPHLAGLFTIRLEPLPLSWEPGDCIAVFGPDGTTTRPYSLSGGVGEPYTELLVRRIDGGTLSPWLTDLSIGDRCEVSSPFGWFRPGEPVSTPRLYAATGSGIAPFLSALRSGVAPPGQVVWGVRDVGDVVFADEFPNLDVFVSRGNPGLWHSGRLSRALSSLKLTPDHHVYACGVDAMIDEVSEWAAQSLPESQIHRECFFTAP